MSEEMMNQKEREEYYDEVDKIAYFIIESAKKLRVREITMSSDINTRVKNIMLAD